MFDFSKIMMRPSTVTGYKPAATDEQLAKLEKHFGHALPEALKFILKNYNGCSPEATLFDMVDPDTGVPVERELIKFYHLSDDMNAPGNIWWKIENFDQFLGPDTVPFAGDIAQQIYYLKWANGVAQVWFLSYVDVETSQTYFVMDSLDKLLESLYVEG